MSHYATIRITGAIFSAALSFLSPERSQAQSPTVTFASPTNGQTLASLPALSGRATASSGFIQTVRLQIREADIHGSDGRWWNGTNFQSVAAILPATVAGANWTISPAVAMPNLNSGISYQLTATAIDNSARSNTISITVHSVVTGLTWDPGDQPLGTAVLIAPNTNGGSYRFKLTTQSPAVGVWRTALKVTSGEANLYLATYPSLNTNSHSYKSDQAGSDGTVLHSSQYTVGQDWHFMVQATPRAQWSLMSGDAFVYELGSLATNASSGTNVNIGAEGMVFFQTTVPAEALAWRLGAGGITNTLYVKKSLAPHPYSYDLIQPRAVGTELAQCGLLLCRRNAAIHQAQPRDFALILHRHHHHIAVCSAHGAMKKRTVECVSDDGWIRTEAGAVGVRLKIWQSQRRHRLVAQLRGSRDGRGAATKRLVLTDGPDVRDQRAP